MRAWKILAIGVLAALGLAACAELAPDINRVHGPYHPKDQFEGSWYFKRTVTDTSPTNSWIGHGDGDWMWLPRVRWKITESYLYGYRDHEYIPGSEGADYEGSDYYGGPVVVFPIKEHFDIRRSYNPQTGEETNVIEKNYERPWNERDYIVVDWSTNLAPDYYNDYFTYISTNGHFVQPHEIDNPDRARFGDNYFDFVNKMIVYPDLYAYYMYYDNVYDWSPGEVHVRYSFLKVDPKNDYEIMPFPDSVDLVDDTGQFVRVNGEVKRIGIMERFGNFRLERATYDPDYEVTDSGMLWRAGRFDLWQRSYDDNGVPIPHHLRTPQPIVYYLNVEFPDDEEMDPTLRDQWAVKKAAYRVGENWNKPFRETVAMLRVMSRKKAEGRCDDVTTSCVATKQEVADELQGDGVPAKMFEMRDNDCNFANVKAYVADHSELEEALNEHIGGIGRLDKANLPVACTVIESLTEGQEDAFTWQRHGDLRYNMLIWVPKHQEAGWLGMGPPAFDPETGEMVTALAHYAGALAESYVIRILDYMNAFNGGVDPFDIITGQDVRRYITKVRADLNREANASVSRELIDEMNHRFNKLGHGPRELLREISPDYANSRLASIRGSNLEDLLIGEADWQLAQGTAERSPALMGEGGDLKELASPARDFRRKLLERQREFDLEMMRTGRDMPYFFDPALLHTAMLLKDRPREEQIAIMRYKVFDAVMTHEVGHNLGMRHNFSASTDALNFSDGYWELRALPEDMEVARAQLQAAGDDDKVDKIDLCLSNVETDEGEAATTQECLGAWEMMYSSIMDYHGKVTGDFGGLGRYDDAYIYFTYGSVLETFEDGAINTGQLEDYNHDGRLNSWDLRSWMFYNDYRKLPQLFGTVEGMDRRQYQRYLWGHVQTTMDEPQWFVPYKMCMDEYADVLPDCRVFDYGVTQSEIMESEITRFKEYYYFSNFNRGRANWYWYLSPMSANQSTLSTILNTFQYMYYFRAHDPSFFETDGGQDFLRASIMGLNLYSEVLGYPPNGMFQELDADGGMLISSQRDGYWRVEPSSDWLGGTTSDLSDTGGVGVVVGRGYFNECDELGSSTLHEVPLGAGRPFFLGFSADYEEWIFTYLGSYFDKDNATFYLAYPQWAFLPYFGVSGYHPDGYYNVDPRTFSVNFFRLFRKEVLSAYYGLIANDLTRYASVMRRVNNQWVFEPRKMIDMNGEMPDYTPAPETKLVLPSTASNLPYYAIYYGGALMSNLLDAEQDFTKLIKIAVKGQQDDIGDFDAIPMYDPDTGEKQKAEFTHPISGVTYRALRQGETPIGFWMVDEANRRKARWQELQGCVENPDLDTGLCQCIYQSQEWNGYNYTCPDREVMGCIMQDRTLRAEQALEYLERQVELMDNVREFHDWFEYMW